MICSGRSILQTVKSQRSRKRIPHKVQCSIIEKEKAQRVFARCAFVSALPIFPASHPASIFGDRELNFCVRDGNRWTLTPISTDCKKET